MNHRRINVAMYTPTFFPYHGGTEVATDYISRKLIRYCNVEIYTFNWVPTLNGAKKSTWYHGIAVSSGLPSREAVEGIPVRRYTSTNLPIVDNFSLRLIRDLILSNVDIIHFQGLHRLPSRWLIQKMVRGKKKVLTTHALYESVKILGQGLDRLVTPIFRESLQAMDHIIALSKTDSAILLQQGIPKNQITVIPNGIDERKFLKRGQFVQKTGKLKILCVARFFPNKNYESLIYALSKLKKDLDFEAYFVGNLDDYRYFDKIQRLIREYELEKTVRLGLSLDDAALVDCYLSCDLFVLPSKAETFPLVILEAMYAGLPVVATRVGCVPELVEDGINGFVVDPEDSDALYEKCAFLCKNQDLRQRMSNANRKKAKEFTWTKAGASTFALYRQLLGGKGRS